MALAREVAASPLAGVRVVELGCGLGLASLAAARAGAAVLATDGSAEALALVERSAHENALGVETAHLSWEAADDLVATGPFDLVLAADVLYEQASVALLLSLLPRLGHEAWLAEPGRSVASDFITQARHRWPVATSVSDGVQIHRLRMTARTPAGTARRRRRAAS